MSHGAPTTPTTPTTVANDRQDPAAVTRRQVARGLAGAVTAVPVALATTVPGAAAASPGASASVAAAAPPVTRRRGKGPRKPRKQKRWHRCRRHPHHTCFRPHCEHRRHQPEPRPTPQPNPQPPVTGPAPEPSPDPTPDPPGGGPTPEPSPEVLPSDIGSLLASRFTYGTTPALQQEMVAAGGPQGWWLQQLDPASIADPEADRVASWWTSLGLDAPTIWQRDQSGVESSWLAMVNYQRWCLVRRAYSRRQVLESATEFFEGHLHVPVFDDGVFGFRADYGRVIRSHALGRYDDLLVAAITHPAMSISLDNATSTKRAPNENLGRELLELHTVGRGQYTEDDVKSSARILTGYRVEMWSTWKSYYDSSWHWTGPVQVMGFTDTNAEADGRPVAEAYLRYLARHPATARRLARKLAIRFVSDDPSDALVEHLAGVYLDHGTAIVPVLRALVAHPEFAASAGRKVRNPTDDVVATYRALGITMRRPTADDSAANGIVWQTADLGQSPYSWSRPDGQPEDSASWSSASRALASFECHYTLSGQWWPRRDIEFRPHSSWVPVTGTEKIRFDDLVDHVSRSLLCRAASKRVLDACCLVTGLTPGTAIGLDHALVRWQMPVLLTTLLDSPEHMTR